MTYSRKKNFNFCWFLFEYRFEFIIRYNFSRWSFALNFDRMSNVKISSNIEKTQNLIVFSIFVFRNVFCNRVIRRRFAISSIFFCRTLTKFETIILLNSIILKMITLFIASIEICKMIFWFFEKTLWKFLLLSLTCFQ